MEYYLVMGKKMNNFYMQQTGSISQTVSMISFIWNSKQTKLIYGTGVKIRITSAGTKGTWEPSGSAGNVLYFDLGGWPMGLKKI